MRSLPLRLLVLAPLLGACSTPADLGATATPLGAARADQPLPGWVDLDNFAILGPGVAGSGQPAMEDFEALAARGYSAVVNLRKPGESFPADEAARAEAAGLRYTSVPMAVVDFGVEDAWALDAALRDAPAGSVLIHCGSGNRVGALWGMYLGLTEGLTSEEAVEAGYRAGMRSPALAERIRASLEGRG